MERLKQELEAKLGTPHARVEKIEGHLREPGDDDWAERDNETSNDEVLEHLDETELREIDAIRATLARIDAGSYGACTACGEAISERRLQALPTTPVCIECAG
jgi:RNA polymerase-binding transcription factor DksA